MIETRLLYYFLAVAREQNLTRAASSLYVTQSTLSRQMMDLEDQLGHQLFIRGKRQLTLTEEGIYFRNRAQEILEMLDRTEAAFQVRGSLLGGDISIACGETAVMEFLAEEFRIFHDLHPDVRLHLYSGDAETVLTRLDQGQADMALLLGATHLEKYDCTELPMKDCFGLLMTPDSPLAQQDSVQMDQLRGLPLIVSEQTLSAYQESLPPGLDFSTLRVVATYNLAHNATYLAEKGIGYVLSLDRLVNTHGRNLVFRPLVPEFSVRLCIATKRYQAFPPAVQAFLKQLKKPKEKR